MFGTTPLLRRDRVALPQQLPPHFLPRLRRAKGLVMALARAMAAAAAVALAFPLLLALPPLPQLRLQQVALLLALPLPLHLALRRQQAPLLAPPSLPQLRLHQAPRYWCCWRYWWSLRQNQRLLALLVLLALPQLRLQVSALMALLAEKCPKWPV